jgi:uncharacterized membrane protein
MRSIDSIREFWQGLYKNDLAELLTRIGLFFSAIVLINSSFTNWNRFPIGTNQTAFLLIVVAYMFGFTLIILSLLTQVRAVKFAILIPIAAGFTVALNYWVFVLWVPAYGTDALAFLHYSALLILQGRNPFQESMLPSLQLFPIPLSNSSPFDTGQLFDGTPYPALAFLLYVPGLLVGLRDIRLVTLVFHLVAILILYFRVNGPMRYLAPLTVVLTQDLLDLTPGGDTDIIWVVPAILMALDLRKVPRAALCFGIACSIKLTPLFLGPFLLAWYYKSSKSGSLKTRLRDPLLFLGVSSIAFLAPNLPFIVASPQSWIYAITSPLQAPLVMYGSGFSGLGVYGFVQLPRAFYAISAVLVYLVLLSALILRFERFQYALWFFPPLALYFAPRSLHEYFIYWYPLAFLALKDWMNASRNQ